MKKRRILLLALLLMCTLWSITANAEREWVRQRTFTFGGRVNSIAFHPDVNQLVIGTNYNNADYNVEIYDTNTFAQLHHKDFVRGNSKDVYAVACRKGWYEVAVGYRDNLSLYNSLGGTVLAQWFSITNNASIIRELAYKPDGKQLAIASSVDKTIRIWHTDHQNGNRKHLRTLRGHTDQVIAVAWRPNGQTLASGSVDGTVRLWNPNTGVNYAVLRGHQAAVRDVAFSPNGQMLASVSGNSPNVILWNVNNQSSIRTMSVVSAGSVAWSPDGNTLAVGQYHSNSRIFLFDPNTGGLRTTLDTTHYIRSLEFKRQLLAAGGEVTGDGGRVTIFKSIPVNVNDVNKDGRVDINDLVAVARDYGKTGSRPTDVNNDNRVDIKDLIQVAEAINPDFAAPTLENQFTTLPFTVKEVQQWIQDAKKQGIDAEGIAMLERLLKVVLHQAAPPRETALLANYPNPFNPETWIPYQLATPAEVTVSIHTADGNLVRTLELGQLPAGVYQDKDRAAYWDGKNEQGESVASGVYFYTLKAGEFSATKKMLIRK